MFISKNQIIIFNFGQYPGLTYEEFVKTVYLPTRSRGRTNIEIGMTEEEAVRLFLP